MELHKYCWMRYWRVFKEIALEDGMKLEQTQRPSTPRTASESHHHTAQELIKGVRVIFTTNDMAKEAEFLVRRSRAT